MNDIPAVLDALQAARLLGISQSTLAKLRLGPNGPAFCKLGRRVVYRREDLAAWLVHNCRKSTSEFGEQRKHHGEEPVASSSKKAANDNIVDRTIALWQPRLKREIRHQDVRQIIDNVIGFFSILAEWSQAEISPPANDSGKAPVSHNTEAHHNR